MKLCGAEATPCNVEKLVDVPLSVSEEAGAAATAPVTITLVEVAPLTKETVLLCVPCAAPVRRTKTDALVTAPLEFVKSVNVLVKVLLSDETAKLTGSFAETVMLVVRFEALTTKLVLGPKFPWVAVRPEMDGGATPIEGALLDAEVI